MRVANETEGGGRTVGSRLRRHPYGMVAFAVGVGFVLGGGPFVRLSAKLVGAGLRVAAMAALAGLERKIIQAVTGPGLSNEEKEN